jgi:general secretion pathway protein E
MEGMSVGTQPDATDALADLLRTALDSGASDLHFDPGAKVLYVRLRVDGILQVIESFPIDLGRRLVMRLMVLGHLLTYRLDIPQEGRLRFDHKGELVEMRVAVIPSTQGPKASVRLPAQRFSGALDDLQLPPRVNDALQRFAKSDDGLLLLTGPAGSGKTTTIYSLLQHIVETQEGVSLISIEDPVECDLPGVTQIQVTPHGEMSYANALRGILRHDPQVLMLGEIRDRATASIAIEAALAGHRLIATFHAGSPEGAIARLLEMQLEPYQITSALYGVVSQRLARQTSDDGTYVGRLPLAEFSQMTPALRQAILNGGDADRFRIAIEAEPGHESLREVARSLAADGRTSQDEIVRILGEPGEPCE